MEHSCALDRLVYSSYMALGGNKGRLSGQEYLDHLSLLYPSKGTFKLHPQRIEEFLDHLRSVQSRQGSTKILPLQPPPSA